MHKRNSKSIAIMAAVAIMVGLPILVFSTQVTQENQQHASFQDFNTGDQISQTNYPDGTMGPPDWSGNYSNAIDEAQTGTLTFLVTDPEQTGKPSGFPVYNQVAVPTHNPFLTHSTGPSAHSSINQVTLTPTYPVTTITPSVADKEKQGQGGGPQAVSGLLLTISKVEVHVAYLSSQSKPLDTWETLNIGGPKTVDLVQLAKGGLASFGLTKLAAGQYTEVRMYVTNASAKLPDGTTVPLDIPGKFNIVRVVHPFTVIAGANTNLTIDFDAQNSVIKAGDQYKLKPVVANFLESRK